jgi:predicted ArsR family transcriptional regulator
MGKREINGQERMWKVMRAMRSFTAEDLVQLAEVSLNFAHRYCRVLKSIGYLREEKEIREGRGRPKKVYKLIKNTGAKALKISRRGTETKVVDPNRQETVYTEVW